MLCSIHQYHKDEFPVRAAASMRDLRLFANVLWAFNLLDEGVRVYRARVGGRMWSATTTATRGS
jgi:hypothetical protein